MAYQMAERSLGEKIGQVIMAGFPEAGLSDDFKRLIEEHKIGNVILFSHNIESTPQLAGLCGEIHNRIREATGLPPFIAMDQEGGVVSRLPREATAIPGAMATAATGRPENARRLGEITALELSALGVNMNMAPVMDINSNKNNPVIGVRSYGDTHETVSSFGLQMLKGLQAGGVIPVIKHFPGHGDTSVDSHLGLPMITKTEGELLQNELIPFINAIREGAPVVMTSHILFPAIETEKVPATLSGAVLTGLLKNRLGFEGLIVTDCLEMNAVKDYYGTAKGALEALKAGAHMVLVSHTARLIEQTARTLEEAVLSGELPMKTLDRAVEKVIALKGTLKAASSGNKNKVNPLSSVGCASHKEEVQNIMEESLTLVEGSLPRLSTNTLFAGPPAYRATMASSSVNREFNFPEYMARHFGGDSLLFPVNPSEEEADRLTRGLERYETLVAATYNGHLNKGQIALVNKLCAMGKSVVAVALRNPYDLGLLKGSRAKLAVYEYTLPAFNALIKVLSGELEPKGKLSVTL